MSNYPDQDVLERQPGKYKKRGKPERPGKSKKKTTALRGKALKRVAALEFARKNPDNIMRELVETSIVTAWVNPKLLIGEPLLQELMWPGYGYMTPLERTEEFARQYIAAYRQVLTEHFKRDDAELSQPIYDELMRNSPYEINALWRGRATADSLGVPYDIYIRTVMAGKLGNGKWTNPPRPEQMYAAVDTARVRGRPTPAEIADRIYAPDWDRRFFADHYVADPAQEAALALLRKDVLAADDRALRLSEYLVDRRAITETRARTMFEPGLVDTAVIIGGKPVSAPLLESAYRPSCFGYPNWGDESPCLKCPVVRACRDRQEAARSAAASINPGPVVDEQALRARNAAYQRAHTAKKKRKREQESKASERSKDMQTK